MSIWCAYLIYRFRYFFYSTFFSFITSLNIFPSLFIIFCTSGIPIISFLSILLLLIILIPMSALLSLQLFQVFLSFLPVSSCAGLSIFLNSTLFFRYIKVFLIFQFVSTTQKLFLLFYHSVFELTSMAVMVSLGNEFSFIMHSIGYLWSTLDFYLVFILS